MMKCCDVRERQDSMKKMTIQKNGARKGKMQGKGKDMEKYFDTWLFEYE